MSYRISIFILQIATLVCCATHARAEVVDISVIINGAQEIPAPAGAPASAAGFGSFQLDDSSKELSWNIGWQDLSGAPSGMHIHGPAASDATAGVIVNLGNIGGLTSPSSGTTTLSDEIVGHLLSGQAYVNIHTALNGSGEIRGQVKPSNVTLSANLDTAQEIPAPTGVPADASGSASVAYDADTNTLGWNIQWDSLSGPATGMHFHGPAAMGATAGVQVNIGNISGLTSPSIGSTVISDEFASQLLSGQWYLNIHTATNGAGEIRGQVVPEPSSLTLVIAAALFAISIRGRRG